MTFVPEAFPLTFSLLYCPFADCENDNPFCSPTNLLYHMESCHKITIINPEAVMSIFDRYINAVAVRIKESSSLASVIGGSSDSEDQELRQKLQSERLQDILDRQQRERQGFFKSAGGCLFCSEVFTEKYQLFNHMYREHSFNIGQLDNLVMVEDFLQLLKDKIDGGICIYCEKTFPDNIILKKHMKCKGHYKINGHNNAYDRFYVVNYMLPGTTWHDLAADLEELCVSSEDDKDDAWENLDDIVDMGTTCLLCDHQESDPELILKHMETSHDFILNSLFSEFYDGIKIVNFIRICWRDSRCAFCSDFFDSSDSLNAHFASCTFKSENKISDEWKSPEYLFPFYEDDNLLSILE